MTRIDFYFHVQDKHELVRRLCTKALTAHTRLTLWASDREACQRLSRLLWTTPATGFIPNVPPHDPLAPVTPIILDCEGTVFPHDEVLVNLRAEVPPFFSRFRRLIELVAADDEADAREARDRFRFYRDRGYELHTHDMSRHASVAD